MDKKMFIFISGALVVIIVFLLIVIMIVQQRKEELANPVPTLIPTATPTIIFDTRPTSKPTVIQDEPLTVDSIEPEDGAVGVLRDTDIVVTFNHIYNFNDFILALRPEAKYQALYDRGNNKVYIRFDKPLEPNTQYTFKVNTYKVLPKTIMFTTGEATGAAHIQF
jgi:hypothetical protein